MLNSQEIRKHEVTYETEYSIYQIIACNCSVFRCTSSVKQEMYIDNKERTVTIESQDISQPEGQEDMEESKAYIGKHLLAGLTYQNKDGEVVKHVQLHGKITRITKDGIFFNRADGKGEFSLPPDIESLKPAIPGAEYRLKSTGEVVSDVDYVSNWTIDMPSEETGKQ